jgi:hypothetical protein
MLAAVVAVEVCVHAVSAIASTATNAHQQQHSTSMQTGMHANTRRSSVVFGHKAIYITNQAKPKSTPETKCDALFASPPVRKVSCFLSVYATAHETVPLQYPLLTILQYQCLKLVSLSLAPCHPTSTAKRRSIYSVCLLLLFCDVC